MSTPANTRLLALMTLLLGCTPREVDTETTTATTSTTADTTTDTPTTGGPGQQTCAPGPLVGVACEPRGATRATWEFSFEKDLDGGFEQPFDAICGVLSVDDDGQVQTIGLLCGGDDARVLSLSSTSPHVPARVMVGDMVHMELAALFTIEVPNLWFSLRAANDQLLVAGLRRAVLPDQEPLQIAPLSFNLLATDCEAFDDSACWIGQRGALAVTRNAVSSVVFDGNAASLGLQDGFQILVGDATRLLCKSDDCEFTAEPWKTNALIVWKP